MLKKIKLIGISTFLLTTLLWFFLYYSSPEGKRSQYSFPQNLLFIFTEPLENSLYEVKSFLTQKYENTAQIFKDTEETEKLHLQLAILKAKLAIYQSDSLENQELRKLLNLQSNRDYNTVTCQIVSLNPSYLYHSIRINCGANQGIKQRMGIISSDGVVGLVLKAYPHYSDVLLLTDPNSNIDVFIARNRSRGILSGNFSNKMFFKYADNKHPIQSGDKLITSGLSGPFPGGLPVGSVIDYSKTEDTMVQSLQVEPSVDIKKISFVLALIPLNKEDIKQAEEDHDG